MAMKIKELKRLIENAPDDATFSIMSFASRYEMEFLFPKRGLLIDSPNGQIFTINQMGTHWSKEWEKENYKIIGWIEKDIDNKLKFIKDEQ